MPQIEVTFTVDLNGLLSVQAVDKRARSQKITITPDKGITTSKFEMEKDAKSDNFTITEGLPPPNNSKPSDMNFRMRRTTMGTGES